MSHRIKRMIISAFAMMMLAIAFTAGASAAQIRADSTLNVREKASITSNRITSMPKGTVRKVLGTSGNWVKVKMNGKKGYVSADYVTYVDGSDKTQSSSSGTKKLLGTFKLTFYGGGGTTASGKSPRVNHTVAVDRSLIALGSKIYIENYGTYYAEDTGGAIRGKILDVYVQSESVANRMGIDYQKVYIIK